MLDLRVVKQPREMTGLEYLRAMIERQVPPPPIAELIGFDLVEVDEGYALFRGEPGERHLNPIGSVHGGFAATLLDSALGCAVHSTLPPSVGYSTLELSVNLVRGITPATGPVLASGRVLENEALEGCDVGSGLRHTGHSSDCDR